MTMDELMFWDRWPQVLLLYEVFGNRLASLFLRPMLIVFGGRGQTLEYTRIVAVAVNNKPRQIDLLHMTYSQKSIIGSGGCFPAS